MPIRFSSAVGTSQFPVDSLVNEHSEMPPANEFGSKMFRSRRGSSKKLIRSQRWRETQQMTTNNRKSETQTCPVRSDWGEWVELDGWTVVAGHSIIWRAFHSLYFIKGDRCELNSKDDIRWTRNIRIRMGNAGSFSGWPMNRRIWSTRF